MIDRIDASRIDDVRRAVRFVASHIDETGRHVPVEGLFAETTGYQCELAGSLASFAVLADEPVGIDASRRMFERLMGRRVDGLWSLDWDPDTRGAKLTVPDNWQEQNAVVSVRYSAATLWSLALYHRATADATWVSTADECLSLLFDGYEFKEGEECHLTTEFAAMAAVLWSHVLPKHADTHADDLVGWIADTFAETAPRDFPFLTALRTNLLLAVDAKRYLPLVRESVDALLAAPRWRFEHDSQLFKHISQTDDHENIRGSVAAAIAMKLHDVAADEAVYTSTPLYAHLAQWIDAQRAPDGGWYEAHDWKTGQRFGRGSPSFFIPAWWIVGGPVIDPRA